MKTIVQFIFLLAMPYLLKYSYRDALVLTLVCNIEEHQSSFDSH